MRASYNRQDLLLWIKGFIGVGKRLARKDEGPVGEIGGYLSPLLEALRTGKAARWIQGHRVLDCGCGRAKLLQMLPESTRYAGLDRDPEMVAFLRRQHPGVHFFCMDLERENLPPEEQFDSLVMTAILEHLVDPASTLRRWVRHVRLQGRVIVTTPVRFGNRLLEVGSRVKLFDRTAYEEHKVLFGRDELEELFLNCGVKPLCYERFEFGGNQLFVGTRTN